MIPSLLCAYHPTKVQKREVYIYATGKKGCLLIMGLDQMVYCVWAILLLTMRKKLKTFSFRESLCGKHKAFSGSDSILCARCNQSYRKPLKTAVYHHGENEIHMITSTTKAGLYQHQEKRWVFSKTLHPETSSARWYLRIFHCRHILLLLVSLPCLSSRYAYGFQWNNKYDRASHTCRKEFRWKKNHLPDIRPLDTQLQLHPGAPCSSSCTETDTWSANKNSELGA